MVTTTLLFLPVLVASASAYCEVPLDSESDWPEWPAVITDADGDAFVYPEGSYEDGSRQLYLLQGDQVMLTCSETLFDDDVLAEDNFYYAIAECQGSYGENLFTVTTAFEEGEYSFAELGCQEEVDDMSQQTTNVCGPEDEGLEIQIGFLVGEDALGVTVTVCFDDAQSRSVYAYHELPAEIIARDTDEERPDFKADDYYPFPVADYYEVDQQTDTIAELVGSSSLADDYIDYDSGLYLARGHLSPASDFVYNSFQDATFYYINAAPQWQNFNAGNWVEVENGIRSFVEDQGRDLVVYTGTNGVMELDDSDGDKVEIYLYPDDEGDRLPVPKFVWKLVVDESDETGIGIVGVNNVHLTEDEAMDDEYRVCAGSEIEGHPMLSSVDSPDDVSRGIVYACEYNDLMDAFPEVPDVGDLGILI